jgi:hypothetical protein
MKRAAWLNLWQPLTRKKRWRRKKIVRKDTMSDKSSFVFQLKYQAMFKKLSADDVKDLLMAIFAYEADDIEPSDLSPIADMAFIAIRQDLDQNRKKWDAICLKRSDYGKKGGRPRKDKTETESEPKADQEKTKSFSEKHMLLKKAKEADCDCDCDCEGEGERNRDREISPPNGPADNKISALPPFGLSDARPLDIPDSGFAADSQSQSQSSGNPAAKKAPESRRPPESRKPPLGRSKPLTAEQAERFAVFWAAYPRKVAKQEAEKSWFKIRPDPDLLARILSALDAAKKTKQWQDGQFIPYPSTWLNQGRWTDELEAAASSFNREEILGLAPRKDPS